MTRADLTQKILSTKRRKGLSWKQIVSEIGGGSAVYVTAAVMGQMKLRPEQAERAAAMFDLAEEEKLLLQEVPYRGSCPPRAHRPINYRLRAGRSAARPGRADPRRIRRWHHERRF
jgi:cyanate lyase